MQIPKKYQACASGLKKKSCRIVKMEKYRAAVIRDIRVSHAMNIGYTWIELL